MTTTRSRILVLTYTAFAQEPRALKQVQYLREAHDVTTAGFGSAPFAGVPHVEIPELAPQPWGLLGKLIGAGLLVLRLYRLFVAFNALDRVAARLLNNGDWDIVIAHDLKVLQASLALAPRRGVILDLHEYAPRQEEQSVLWRLLIAPYFRWMCRTMVPKAAAVVTVSQGIADEYRREFGFVSTVVVNATPFYELDVTDAGRPLRLVHSGVLAAQRRLDLIIQGVCESSADVTLDLFLVGDDSALLAQLKSLADGDERIQFREPVSYGRLVETLNGYDVGVHLLPSINFNHRWALPNKFFDFIQARLGVIVGPSPEMMRFVEKYGFGVVLPDFEPSSLAAVLEALTTDTVMGWKKASATHARELSSESQATVWIELAERVLRDATP